MNQKIIGEITDVLNEITAQTQAMAQSTGLHCKAGCGKCCEHPHIETTVTEMLPMALHLWQTGQARQILENIEAATATTCIFYKPDPLVAGNGRCTQYQHRPGICRLFGFSAKKNKAGQKELVTCRVIKEEYAQDYAQAQQHIASGLKVPAVTDFAMRIFAVDPAQGQKLMPINEAAVQALGQTSLFFQIP
jgi:Fe-S-cluster containining protein